MSRDSSPPEPTDRRPVVERAESAVFEAELESEGIEIKRCECGTAGLEPIPGRDRGLRCAGCKRIVGDTPVWSDLPLFNPNTGDVDVSGA